MSNSHQIIRASKVAEMLSVSKTTVWRMEKDGKLPPKIRLSSGVVGWLESDIIDYIKSLKIG